jgi:copper(I)-binding protein
MSILPRAVVTAGMLFATFSPALADGVVAKDAWARARMEGMRAGGAYVSITNTDSTSHALIGAESPVADVVELHSHRNDNGVMRMEQVEEMPVPPGDTVTLKPGGLHIMLIGLRQTLTEGTSFPLTLMFRNAPPVSVTVNVLGVAAMGPSH